MEGPYLRASQGLFMIDSHKSTWEVNSRSHDSFRCISISISIWKDEVIQDYEVLGDGPILDPTKLAGIKMRLDILHDIGS